MTSVHATKKDGKFYFDTKLIDNRIQTDGVTVNGIEHYVHPIPYKDNTFYIFYKDKLTGSDSEKLESDWRKFCKETP